MGIHDETIRAILQDKEEEIALLELAFPGESKNLWNVDTVQLEKDTFVSEGDSENRFDIMLSVEDKDGNKRRIYFLFEHKSYKSNLVFLDILRYISLAYKEHISHKNQDLGPILPILLIQTEEPWDPPSLKELLGFSEGEGEAFEKFLPYLDIRIVNLHRGVMEILDLRIFLHFFLYFMHYIRHESFLDYMDDALHQAGKIHFQEHEKGIDKFRIFAYYINKARRKNRREEMAQLIEKNLSERELLEYMTIAERERYEGRMEKAIETARMMKAEGDSIEKILRVTGLSKDELEKIL